jgi:pilus assembly protein Flp/PilA
MSTVTKMLRAIRNKCSAITDFSTRPFWIEQRGATATEYGITVGFIAFVIIFGVGLFGVALDGYFTALEADLKAALGIP